MNFSKLTGTESTVLIQGLNAEAYTVPTDFPESDGTMEWNSTTLVLVEIFAADKVGIGYTYAASATANFILDSLKDMVIGKNVLGVEAITQELIHAVRN